MQIVDEKGHCRRRGALRPGRQVLRGRARLCHRRRVREQLRPSRRPRVTPNPQPMDCWLPQSSPLAQSPVPPPGTEVRLLVSESRRPSVVALTRDHEHVPLPTDSRLLHARPTASLGRALVPPDRARAQTQSSEVRGACPVAVACESLEDDTTCSPLDLRVCSSPEPPN